MKQIFKILSKSAFPILVVITFLFVQAMLDLQLPDYTARIVNVGIQQGGIEDSVPKAIRKEELEKILLFTQDDESILKNYLLIKKGDQDYLKDYPILETNDLYLLKDISEKERTELNEKIEYQIYLVNMFSSNDVSFLLLLESFGIPKIPEGMTLLDVFKLMGQEELNEILTRIYEKMENLEPQLVKQVSISYLKNEYQVIGIDTNGLQLNYIITTGLKMLGITFLIMVVAITISYLAARVAARFSRDLRSKIVSKVMSFSNQELEHFSIASLITRCTNDIQQIQMLIVMSLRMVIYAPIIGIGAYTKVSGNSMSWVIGVGVLAILILVITLLVVALPKFQIVQNQIDKLNLITREILTGIPVIRAFSNQKFEEKRFDEANHNLMKTNLFVNRVMTFMMPMMTFIMNATSILIIWVGASRIDAGTMQVGSLIAFISYTMQIIMAFLMFSAMSVILPRSWVSMKRIAEVLNTDLSIKEKEKVKKNVIKEGIIEFKNVSFKYPGAEENVLENISFKAGNGTTAIIGSTGSGKSTLINLIPRFYDVTSGEILIDGLDIRDLKISDLRANIGYVPQRGVLFSGTIKSNILIGNENINNEEIDRVVSIAQATEFIEGKEDKYEAQVSQGGTNLSGGQKQRLSIARAIALKPKIFIFDDSFSALDFKTDKNLRAALNKEIKDSTILLVAQRISTVLNADQIIVLDNGKVVGIGTHNELLESCEVYREIALSQLSEEELGHEK